MATTINKLPKRTQRQLLTSNYKNARSNLLLVAGFTFINIIMLVAKSFSYFLFSATVPHALVDYTMYFCGMYPADYYGEDYAYAIFWPQGVFYIALAVAAVIIALYILCYVFSKNNKVGWLICALVMFVLDTACMFILYAITVDIILDVIFHALILIILIRGIAAHFKLKNLPPEEIEISNEPITDSTPLRDADTQVKERILLQTRAFDCNIVYRRVKHTNELVINGKVYDEYTARMELPHELTANLNGHVYTAGLGAGTLNSYISVDGNIQIKKIRWI